VPLQGFNVIYTKTTPLLDEGIFSFSYWSDGKIHHVTYPNQQGTEDYSYDSEGKLQSISYPDTSVMAFTWTPRDRVSTIQYTTSQQEVHSYTLSYDNENKVKASTYSIDGLQQYTWAYVWGPQGLEYANKNNGALTQNFTTDPRGRILSMSYTSATYSGELYFHYDALGNTTLLTDASANPKASFQYDLHTGRLMSSWNPDGIEVNTNIIGGIALKYQGSPFMEITPAMKAAMERSNRYFFGDSWGSVSVWTGKPIVDTNLEHEDRCIIDPCVYAYQKLGQAWLNIQYWKKQKKLLETEGYYYLPEGDAASKFGNLRKHPKKKIEAGKNPLLYDYPYHLALIQRNIDYWSAEYQKRCEEWRDKGCDRRFPLAGQEFDCDPREMKRE